MNETKLVTDPEGYTSKELKNLSVQSLRKVVWSLTNEANKRAATMNSPLSNTFIERLQITGGGQVGPGKKIAAKVNYKSKSELIQQALELQKFNRWDTESDIYEREFTEKTQKAYQNFKNNYMSDISEAEYDDLVSAFGAVGPDWLERFGSDNFVELVKEARNQKKSFNLTKAMKEVIRQEKKEIRAAKKMGISRPAKTQSQLMEDLYTKLGIQR